MARSATQAVAPWSPHEPVHVFGAGSSADVRNDGEVMAMRVYGADAEKKCGPSGHAYAIPCRDDEGTLLPPVAIGRHVTEFMRYARAQPQVRFHIARFACEPGAHEDAIMAKQFEHLPANCRVPGVWGRYLDPDLPVRMLIYDPFARFKEPRWQDKLRRYLALNAEFRSDAGVEIVSFGSARSIVAVDTAARALGLRHRVFGPNEEAFGRDARAVAEMKAIWYATHFLSLCDFRQTAPPHQFHITGAATRGGLVIDQMDVNVDD